MKIAAIGQRHFLTGKGKPDWKKKASEEAIARNLREKVSYKTLENTKEQASAIGIAARTLRAKFLLAKRMLRKKTNASRR
ncbi:MAG: hypothetical protein NTZ73_02565 [Candidatus Diapherotrites archaeon]|nr:hypothetical protein [Candidatus Diapherotrites archaeon]